MVKVQNGIATREPIPDFLDQKGTPEALASLLDLSWTDPALGVQDAAWWTEENTEGELGTNKKWGIEVLTIDAERKVVKVARKQVAMTTTDKSERDTAIQQQWSAQIASRRFKAEESGTTWNGYGIATDRSSQNKITQEDIAVNRGLRTDGSGWKCLDLSTGVIVFRPTSNAEIQQLSAAVYLHVSSSFKREEELLADVADGSITAVMVEEGWLD